MKPASRQSPVGDVAAAFLLLSRISVPYPFDAKNPPDFIQALWAFPFVGMCLGGIGGLALIIMALFPVPQFVAAAVCICVMAFLSGALHEDGLADMFDGFGAGRTPEDTLRIMHDSHIGSYGVLALILSTIIRIGLFSALIGLHQPVIETALIVGCIAAGARAQIPLALMFFPVAPGAKLAKVTGQPSMMAVLMAAGLWLGPLYVLAGPAVAAASSVIAGLTIWGCGRMAMRKINGLNGDVMGSMILLAEIVIAFSVIACAHLPVLDGPVR